MVSKLVLGGAQLGSPYGITNQTKILKLADRQKILETALHQGINTVDIALAYGIDSELINRINPGLSVHTKIQIANSNLNADFDDAKKIHHLTCIYIHDPENVDFNNSENILACKKVQETCRQLGIQFGLSIYSEKTLIRFINNDLAPDIVQYPYNALFKEDKIGEICENFSIASVIRSIFLQGALVTDNISSLPSHLRDHDVVKNWHNWLKKEKHNGINACSNETTLFNRTKVIGFDNLIQLNQYLDEVCRQRSPIQVPQDLKTNDMKLLDPREWPKNT